MSELHISYDADAHRQRNCPCCQAQSLVVWGYVHKGRVPWATYTLVFTDHHASTLGHVTFGRFGRRARGRNANKKKTVVVEAQLPGRLDQAQWVPSDRLVGVSEADLMGTVLPEDRAQQQQDIWRAILQAVEAQDRRVQRVLGAWVDSEEGE